MLDFGGVVTTEVGEILLAEDLPAEPYFVTGFAVTDQTGELSKRHGHPFAYDPQWKMLPQLRQLAEVKLQFIPVNDEVFRQLTCAVVSHPP